MITHYARKLSVKQIEDELASLFLKDNHRQSDTKTSYKIQSIGLFSGEDLLGVAVFSTPRTEAMRRKYTAELLRMAFLKGHRIIGGASKLINFFIKEYKPSDFFTYQDTTGENTLVYQHSGMTLVKDGMRSKKQYLVAPNKTLATATRNEALGLAYATRYGPDRILGTRLGEVFDSSGKRKSNKRLFEEELGWHIEETTGDSVWEWIDPDRTYYTYKITATDSEKYYYGVSHVKKANATIEECLAEKYYGSGGGSVKNKFSNWKSKHKDHLIKEVLDTFPTAAPAYESERLLVGDFWKNDPNCLNSAHGGKSGGAFVRRQNFETDHCSKHGETKFRNGKCAKCWTAKRWSEGECELHGSVKLRDGLCINCQNQKTVIIKECSKHGRVKHQNNDCAKCRIEKQLKKSNCEIHGLNAAHINGKCVACKNLEQIDMKECSTHGLSKHIGGRCYKCFNSTKNLSCSIHGLSPHNGSTCIKCSKDKSISVKTCPDHGEVKFSGSTCMTCHNLKNVSKRVCAKHGETKFQGDKCSKCTNASVVVLKVCDKHGETKHRGSSCYKCAGEKRKDKKANK